ncbi:MAG: hypothetical protein HWQ58_07840 [Nostoc sp. LPT]|nr:hypothetical protein [Nostoc sp. LPT]
MESIVSRLDVTQIFCDVNDFCSSWERMWQQVPHTINDWRASQQIKDASIGSYDDSDGFANAKGERL